MEDRARIASRLDALGATLPKNIAMIADITGYLRSRLDEVMFEASWRALADSIEHKLRRDERGSRR